MVGVPALVHVLVQGPWHTSQTLTPKKIYAPQKRLRNMQGLTRTSQKQ